MKKCVVSLVSILALLAPTQVLAEHWVPVDRGLHIDTDSVLIPSNARHIRLYWEALRGNHPGHGFITKREANCETGHLKRLEVVEYDGGEFVSRLFFVKDRGGYVNSNLRSRIFNVVGCNPNNTNYSRKVYGGNATVFYPPRKRFSPVLGR